MSNQDDELDRKLTTAFTLGRAVGWEEVEALLRDKAGRAFSVNDNAVAYLCRSLATDCQIRSKKLREEWEENKGDGPQ